MPKPSLRAAHNAKARLSTAGTRKKGKTKRRLIQDTGDPNADILKEEDNTSKEDEKQRILSELSAASEAKWSSKKKKRLEKYIDKKLKREERVVLFEKLAKTQITVPSTVLQSSSTLGTGVSISHDQMLAHSDEHIPEDIAVDRKGKRKRSPTPLGFGEPGSGVEDQGLACAVSQSPSENDEDKYKVVVDTSSLNAKNLDSTIGSALRRDSAGAAVTPKYRKRLEKGLSLAVKKWNSQSAPQQAENSDTSFDSSDSEDDNLEEDLSDHEEPGETHSGNRGELDRQSDQNSSFRCESRPPPKARKAPGFKDWAIRQLDIVRGNKDGSMAQSVSVNEEVDSPALKKRRIVKASVFIGPLGEETKFPSSSFAQEVMGARTPNTPKKMTHIQRSDDVVNARLELPIVAEEQLIMETIMLNPVVILCGETGSGKTTQIPQFLYEAGFGTAGTDNPGIIGITQPRRVAAMSMASRVGHELSLSSAQVSYQIRYDATVSPSTSIKFMTDGVLLRELASDFLLTKYSVIVVDEAHERSINTDILIGVLSRVIKLREDIWKMKKDGAKPLRLIIMSATLRVSDFSENKLLFASPPPIIKVDARQYPVAIHFSRRTHLDYVSQAIRKTSKIHTQLPPGGILIFLTGQNEIIGVCKKLEAKYGAKAISLRQKRFGGAQETGASDGTESLPFIGPAQADVEVEEIDLGGQNDPALIDVDDDQSQDILERDSSDTSDDGLDFGTPSDVPMHVIPLYSLLASEKQMRVFEPAPPGHRLVVVSTNVAETSITIPGIRYVVDCGRAKERYYDVSTGVQTFRVSWISKASAAQRAGRAGRTGPGHCYRLYSSAFFEHNFESFTTPEIQRMPIDSVVLQMKSMHIDAVVNFPFPTPPERASLSKAEKVLGYLGALTALGSTASRITELGRTMALFPLLPRFARMLVTGQQQGCLPYVIAIVSALSVGDPFIYEDVIESADDAGTADGNDIQSEGKGSETRRRLRKDYFQVHHLHASLGRYTSDMFKLLSVIGAYEYAGGGQHFCSEHFLRPKAMEEIHKLRAQISNIVQVNFPGVDSQFYPHLSPPNEKQLKALRQILTAGFIDQVAIRADLLDKQSSGVKYATAKGVPYRVLGSSPDAFIHPSSILINQPAPEYVVYHEIVAQVASLSKA